MSYSFILFWCFILLNSSKIKQDDFNLLYYDPILKGFFSFSIQSTRYVYT